MPSVLGGAIGGKSQEPITSYRYDDEQKKLDILGNIAIIPTMPSKAYRPRRFPRDNTPNTGKVDTMATKHKAKGNQTAEQALQLTVNTSLLEVGTQLNLYGKSSANEKQAKEAKEKAKKELDKLIHVLFKAKVAIGTLPRGMETGDFDASKLSPNVKIAVDLYLAMEDVSHNVRRNYISSLRVCIKEDRKFNPNVAREKAKEAKEAKEAEEAEEAEEAKEAKEAPKPDDTKAGAVKQSLADVIKMNFKTLLANNPQAARDLVDELADMLD